MVSLLIYKRIGKFGEKIIRKKVNGFLHINVLLLKSSIFLLKTHPLRVEGDKEKDMQELYTNHQFDKKNHRKNYDFIVYTTKNCTKI